MRPNSNMRTSWFEVVLWVLLLGPTSFVIAVTIPTDRPGRVFLIVVSVVTWTWVVAGLRRRGSGRPDRSAASDGKPLSEGHASRARDAQLSDPRR